MKSEISALTGLRFVAAFLVFIFHVNMRTKMLFLPWPVYNIVSHGAFGVTVFFVLSGFLLTYSHMKDFPAGEIRDAQYYRWFMYKRIARIYPAYFVGLLLFTGACALYNESPKPAVLVPDLLMVEAIIPSISMAWYGSGAWSVSIEIFFYLFFPLLLPLLMRAQQARVLWYILAAVIILGTLGGLPYQFLPGSISYSLMYASPLFRCSEFIAGMLSGLLVFRFGWRVKEWKALLAIGIAGTYIAGFGPKLYGFVPHNWMVVPAIIILLASIVEAKQTKVLRFLTHPWLVYAGRISYCFYIAQLPLFCIQDFMLMHQPALPWWSGVLTFGVTTAMAIILHHFVEMPIHQWLLHQGAKSAFLNPALSKVRSTVSN